MTPSTDHVPTPLPASEQAAIGRTLGLLQRAFAERNATLLEQVYSDDADWVNAFGSVKKGRAEIVGYLTGLFADGNFDAGTLVGPPESSMRVVEGTVVVVSAHLQIVGQLRLDGSSMPVRDNFSVRVLHRRADGRWLIVSEMYMDANQEQSYANHS